MPHHFDGISFLLEIYIKYMKKGIYVGLLFSTMICIWEICFLLNLFHKQMKHQYFKRFSILLSIVISLDFNSLIAQTAG
jgi:hypothetical protein